MGEAKRKRDYRNRPENLAKSFYEGKLSQRDAGRMREDRDERLMVERPMANSIESAQEEVDTVGLWLILALGIVFSVGLWYVWP